MSSLSVVILAVIVLVGAVVVIRAWRERAAEERLRRNPVPREVIEIRLPRDISDGAQRMQAFYRKLHASLLTDDDSRRQGLRTVDAVYYVEAGAAGQSPYARFLLYADPDLMPMVKRLVKQSFSGMAEVVTHSQDPLQHMVEAARPEGINT